MKKLALNLGLALTLLLLSVPNESKANQTGGDDLKLSFSPSATPLTITGNYKRTGPDKVRCNWKWWKTCLIIVERPPSNDEQWPINGNFLVTFGDPEADPILEQWYISELPTSIGTDSDGTTYNFKIVSVK